MSGFDEIVDRRNTQSYKWDVAEGELPMWVADMDFKTAPPVIEALKRRVEHGIFGYSAIPEEWYDAYIGWWKRRHNLIIEKDWLIFTTGVVPAISSVVRKLTYPAENVIVITPAYNIFFNSIYNNGRNIVECLLKYSDGKYELDLQDLEEKCSDPQSTLLILCNPHNPTGIIWDKKTLEDIGDICYRNNVLVLSDEIHCDITKPGSEYVPFASVSEVCRDNSITCIAPTKAFNIAGLQTAAVCVPNPVIRHKVWRGLNTDEVAEGNAFACDVAIAAFNEGEEWFDNLRTYLFDNRAFAEKYIAENIPMISCVKAEATYLLWIDCHKIDMSSDDLAEKIREFTGLYVSEGCEYRGDGKHFLRLNLACPRQVLEEGLGRLKDGIGKIEKKQTIRR